MLSSGRLGHGFGNDRSEVRYRRIAQRRHGTYHKRRATDSSALSRVSTTWSDIFWRGFEQYRRANEGNTPEKKEFSDPSRPHDGHGRADITTGCIELGPHHCAKIDTEPGGP
jgi:hypothetical protein